MPLQESGEHSKNALTLLLTTSKPSETKFEGRGSTGKAAVVKDSVLPFENRTGSRRYA
jgi:hypothetical protein